MTFTRPKIMGILNVTPDSFSDGGRYADLDLAVKQAVSLIDSGADILDIGGESTRPGAAEVPVQQEIERVVPVIMAIREKTRHLDEDVLISVDTRKPEVAEAAIIAGADIWNDVSALTFDTRSEPLAAELGCVVILMHHQGSPETMQDNPYYEDSVADVKSWLARRLDAAEFAGIERKNLMIDPGIGFGKRLNDNCALLQATQEFVDMGVPVLIGASRKSFIGKIDGSTTDDRMGGSVAAALWAAECGASILRVHDVSETVQALKIWEAIKNAK